MSSSRLTSAFFQQDVLDVAPALLGQNLVILSNGLKLTYLITETEAYRGEDDLACHASKGKTERNHIMYALGGYVYVYLVYGMYWMLNFVTGNENDPQAVLIRGIEGFNGPGKLTKQLDINKTFYGEDLAVSERIWVEASGKSERFITAPRVGIDYAGDYWKNVKWRFIRTD
ncbi:MAG: 3-methyladenine DNA glycosylase [Bacteroidetes bacterium HGW-Bacteroidetes-21]|jgi:DNA-3-methyladenine glycosylase|nr:MAG: 3-methyladenine DNA glycosylase [Bacteroidetes bacterium HGW-Bacteroidetes-21]